MKNGEISHTPSATLAVAFALKGTWVTDNVSSPAIDKADPAASAADEPTPNGTRANLGVFGQTAEASKSP